MSRQKIIELIIEYIKENQTKYSISPYETINSIIEELKDLYENI